MFFHNYLRELIQLEDSVCNQWNCIFWDSVYSINRNIYVCKPTMLNIGLSDI